MSNETTKAFDPWADGDTSPASEGIDWSGVGEGDEFDLLDEFDLEEVESGEEIRVRDDFTKKYDNPHDVGLMDGMWVPVRILDAKVEEKHIPRLSSKTCIAVKGGKPVAVLYDAVEKALKEGAEEVIKEVPLPYFVCTANHAAPRFGERRFDYDIAVPVFTIKTARRNPRPGFSTGFANDNGRSLRVATGVLSTGDKLTKANMHEVAEQMVGKIVLARVSIVQSKKARTRNILDENGSPVMVQVNPETGDAITVFRPKDGSGYILDDGSGAIWEGDESQLFPLGPDRCAVRSDGDDAMPLTEEYHPYVDYINPPFLPLPERKVMVERATEGGGSVEGEITLDTIGAIARGATPGVQVDVLLRTGETVTATWLGTEWVEKPKSKDGEGSGMDAFVGSQEEALASM